MKDLLIIHTARLLLIVFSPFYMAIVGFIALFFFSYLSILPLAYKLYILSLVALFTIVLPYLFIYLYRKINGWTKREVDHRRRRMIPYLLSIASYICGLYMMRQNYTPHYMSGILIGALLVQLSCALINMWWKISAHTAAVGGVAGALIGFSLIFHFNPITWLNVILLLAGAVGSSCIIMRQHTLPQVGLGFLVGLLCGFSAIYYF